MAEPYFTVKQLQEALDISERTIFRLINDGKLTGFKIGREWRFTQADIDKFIENQRKEAEEEIAKRKSKDAA